MQIEPYLDGKRANVELDSLPGVAGIGPGLIGDADDGQP
jgi:hypothetical protein